MAEKSARAVMDLSPVLFPTGGGEPESSPDVFPVGIRLDPTLLWARGPGGEVWRLLNMARLPPCRCDGLCIFADARDDAGRAVDLDQVACLEPRGDARDRDNRRDAHLARNT